MPILKIIRASAGSGKTFLLIHEYLRLLFTERDNFRHILAVTFTNKATEEMKSRIILELHLLSSGKESKQLPGLISSTSLSETQIRGKAKVILKRLLHQYSWFSVSTIDSFFQRVIRSFTRELGIQGGYTIELDHDGLLTAIIDKLLLRAGTNQELLSWLTRFAESLIEKGESWDLKKGMRALGGEIFKEEFKAFEETVLKAFSDRSFLTEYQSSLYAIIKGTETDYRNFGLKARQVFERTGLQVDDFKNKSKGPAGFLAALENGAFREPTDTARDAATDPGKWYAASSPHKSKIIEAATLELMPLMKQVLDYYLANHRSFYSAGAILKNLYTLGIMADLSQLSYEWCAENNAFPISEAPVFLHRIIDGNDTPFIYEKTGYWYHHYMIDEFQDTSLLQWLNFKPLISNSLSQDFDSLTVGDAKQSIYRWRNSNWEILEKTIHQDFISGITRVFSLNTNWRSKTEIIRFNNTFFRSAAEILQQEYDQAFRSASGENPDPVITQLYGNTEQNPGNPENTGGYVQVDFHEGDEESDYAETIHAKLIGLLCRLQDQGFHLSDIAILTRKNSEAKQLADYLLNYANEHADSGYRFDVISDEALRLGSSTLVTFLVALLQYLVNPQDKTNNYLLKWLLKTYISPDEKTGFEHYLPLIGASRSYSLAEVTERLITLFRLQSIPGERIYLHAFRDMVADYTRTNSGEISKFLEYWKETGRENSVSAPSGQDAIRILTIHKSKGLEFKIVIVPFCNWELHSYRDIFLWCEPQEKPFNKIGLLPLLFSAHLRETCFSADYYREYQRQLIDNLNLLYVAFTRAREGLFVMCKAREKDQIKTVSDLVYRILNTRGYSAGELPAGRSSDVRKDTGEYVTEPASLSCISSRVRIATQGKTLIDPLQERPYRPINEGRILHEAFSMIHQGGDITRAVDKLLKQGKVSRPEREKYIHFIENAIQDPMVSSWYAGEWRVLSEAEIILPGGATRRPDRIMVRDDHTLIVDYKFGDRIDPGHEHQVREYAGILQTMGYQHPEAFVWYVSLGQLIRLAL